MLNIQEIRDVNFLDPVPTWSQDGVMAVSPYRDDAGFHLIGRGYTKDAAQPVYSSCIFRADGKNPFEFVIHPTPILMPGSAGHNDCLACEDPTRIPSSHCGDTFLYSQVRKRPSQEMATRGKCAEDLGVYVSLGYARELGNGCLELQKVLEPTEQRWWRSPIDMCKEGELMLQPEQEYDPLFYEFADSTSSRLAVAKAFFFRRKSTVRDSELWLDTRPGKWDSDHVSTGPIVDFGTKKLMFYNGRDSQTWAIGEVVFNPLTLEVEYRSEEPLIIPPKEIGWANQFIAFSSGVLIIDGIVHLYHHIADKRVRCAVGTFK